MLDSYAQRRARGGSTSPCSAATTAPRASACGSGSRAPRPTLKLLQGGRADWRSLDINDLALARERGRTRRRDGDGAAAARRRARLARHPLPARPRGPPRRDGPAENTPPCDRRGAGRWRPRRVRRDEHRVQRGARLASGATPTAFWNVEGVALREPRPGVREFASTTRARRATPSLCLAAPPRRTLDEGRNLVERHPSAPARVHGDAGRPADRRRARTSTADRGLDREALMAQLDAAGPAFTAGAVLRHAAPGCTARGRRGTPSSGSPGAVSSTWRARSTRRWSAARGIRRVGRAAS